jgi:hypothetical protein
LRLVILDQEFQQVASEVIAAFEKWVDEQQGGMWLIDSPNYEGVRVKVMNDAGKQTGWLLLRSSLHDPLLVVNVESDIDGGNTIPAWPTCTLLSWRTSHEGTSGQQYVRRSTGASAAGVKQTCTKLFDFFSSLDVSGGEASEHLNLSKLEEYID